MIPCELYACMQYNEGMSCDESGVEVFETVESGYERNQE